MADHVLHLGERLFDVDGFCKKSRLNPKRRWQFFASCLNHTRAVWWFIA